MDLNSYERAARASSSRNRHGAGRSRTMAIMATLLAVMAAGLAALAPPVSAAPAAKSARDLPALHSDPAPKSVSEVPVGDFTNPPPDPSQAEQAQAKVGPSAFDPARSKVVDAETTPTRKVFSNPDGSRTVQVSPAPVRFRDAAGAWQDIDLTLAPASDGTLRPKSAQSGARLSAQADATVAAIDTPAGSIGLRHAQSSTGRSSTTAPTTTPVPATTTPSPTAAPSAPVQASATPATTKGATATYAGAVDGHDVILGPVGNGVEETVLLPDAKSSPTYTDELVLPAGVTARDGANGGVELVDGAGTVVAVVSDGLAYDAAPGGRGRDLTPVKVRLSGTAAAAPVPGDGAVGQSVKGTTVATVTVSIDPAWLASPARVFPVTVDPVLYTTILPGAGFDTFVYGGAAADTSYGSYGYIGVGSADGGTTRGRGLISFDVSSIAAANDYVTEAHVSLYNWYSVSCSATSPINLSAVAAGANTPIGTATTWNHQPDIVSTVTSTRAFARTSGGTGNCAPGWENFDATALARDWVIPGASNLGVELRAASETDSTSFKWFYASEVGSSVAPVLVITYDHLPGFSTPVSPVAGAVISTATPTMAATVTTDPDGDPVKYWFRATPAADADSGAKMVDSGWLTGTPAGTPCGANQICYTVPAGALSEGVLYHWHVFTGNETRWRQPQDVATFRIDLGLGDKGAQPRDGFGGLSVNLASGNLVVHAASPSFSTANGTAGLTYTYNSQAPANLGLTGAYYADPGNQHVFTGSPVMIRTDPTIDHFWGADGPGGGVDPTAFMVRWTGTVKVPVTGSYIFAADHDDGVRIWVNNVQILNRWVDGDFWNPSEPSSSINLTANVAVPITVEYYQNGGPALATITVLGNYGPNNAPAAAQLPPSWLAPDAAVSSPVLPQGWTMGPTALHYASATIGDRWVAFTDTSGARHTYTWTGSGYAPPPEEDGVVGSDAGGALTLAADDGITYVFDRNGNLASATAATDDGSPTDNGGAGSISSLTYTWSGTKPRLSTITDPAGRQITLRYGGRTPGCGAAPSGFDSAAPADMLCEVDYWDGTHTSLYYAAGQLARIEDPGGAITDFAYSLGYMYLIRSPLAADAVAAPATGRANDVSVLTQIAYGPLPVARVSSVTLPSPTAGATRPQHGYAYNSATETIVGVAGLSQPLGFARKVSFVRGAAGGLTVVDTDADGVATTSVYDAGDRLLSATDAAGRRSSVTYDDGVVRAQPSSQATNTYGPAPVSCFGADNRPNGSCTPAPGHTATSYDTDPLTGAALTGLAATWWPNRSLAGTPTDHTLTVPPAGGSLVPADPPSPTVSAANWSARYSGEISLDATGTYGFATVLTGQARVYVDDALVVNAWSPHGSTTTVTGTFANAVAGRHRIHVDYATQAGAAPGLALRWTPPGGSDGAVPAAKLAPRYSVPSASVTDDTAGGPRNGDAVYMSMANALVVDATADRGGANLVTHTTYEAPGSGYMRPKSVTPPAGASSATSYDYYGRTEAPTTPCPGAAANQGMALRSTTGATPATGAALVHTYAYDAGGRVVGSAVAGDWTCSAYDARGRVASVALPAYNGEPAHTFTYNYAVGANPLVTSTSEGAAAVTTTVDLLGRVVSYTDAWNKTTTTAYDLPGRVTDTNGPAGASHLTYTTAGRTASQSLDGAVLGTAAYNATTGELASVSYAAPGGNGTSLSAVTRSPAGATTGLTWTGPGGTVATDAVTRSQAGRVTDETIDGTDADPANPNFTYDPLGRLTKARVTGHVLDYGFATSGGCGPQSAPGLAGNRSSVVDNGGTATTYCYDNADRLVSSSDPAVGTLAYDSHGNTTTMGTQTLVYDGADRHMETKVNGATVVRYGRDATGRITSRTEGTTVTHYGFAGPGDSPAFTMDASNNVTERTIGLIGGAMVTKRGGLLGVGDVWSYPNVHGDVIATADNTGVKQGPTRTYDPYGQALTALPDNSAGNFDYGWLGSNQRPIEHAGSLATIEMGARQYVPSLGRFLQVDPVAGGSCNDYDYACGDPVNSSDVSGTCVEDACIIEGIAVATAIDYFSSKLFNHGSELPVKRRRKNVFYRYVTAGEVEAILTSHMLRGGRPGRTYFTGSRYTTAGAAERRLALPQTPEYRVEFSVVSAGRVGGRRVAPDNGQPGGGYEYYSDDPVVVRVTEIAPLS